MGDPVNRISADGLAFCPQPDIVGKPPVLSVESFSKSFGARSAVENVSFTLMEHEFVAVLGPSGAGKTTLFRCITGSAKSDTGRIRFGGTEIERLRVDHAVHAVADGRICLAALNAGNLPSVAAAIRQVSSRH